MARIQDLPNEILLQIFRFFPMKTPTKPDLVAICVVDKRFNKLAIPLLYHTVILMYGRYFSFEAHVIESLLLASNSGIKYIRGLAVCEEEIDPLSRHKDCLDDACLDHYYEFFSERSKEQRNAILRSMLRKLDPGQLISLQIPFITLQNDIPQQTRLESLVLETENRADICDLERWTRDLGVKKNSLKICSLDCSTRSLAAALTTFFGQKNSIQSLTLKHSLQFTGEVSETSDFDPYPVYHAMHEILEETNAKIRSAPLADSSMSKLRKVNILDIDSVTILDIFFPPAHSFPNIRELVFTECYSILASGPKYLTRFPNISTVNITLQAEAADYILRFLQHCPRLLKLTIRVDRGCRYPEESSIMRHSGLRYLWLEYGAELPWVAAQPGLLCVASLRHLKNLKEFAAPLALDLENINFMFEPCDIRAFRCLKYPFIEWDDDREVRLRAMAERIATRFPPGSSMIDPYHLKIIVIGSYYDNESLHQYEIYAIERTQEELGSNDITITAQRMSMYDVRYHYPDLEIVEADRTDRLEDL
ncbi:hypothetical protein ABW19_dt0205062 [Dactylella cylindrospora]|nr:hypothetical protein ABW19_dt0205062 [Dactylella cylindrospora]